MTKIISYILLGIALMLNIILLTIITCRVVKINKKTKLYEVTIKDKWQKVDYIICNKYKIEKNKLYLSGIREYNHCYSFLSSKTYSFTYIVSCEIKDISW